MPVFEPEKPRIDPAKIVKTTSQSPLCHISVGKWMKASGLPLKSAERKDRCARVAASTAYRVVELLNDWHDGKYVPTDTFKSSSEHGITGQFNCMECHGDNVPEAPQASSLANHLRKFLNRSCKFGGGYFSRDSLLGKISAPF